MQIFEITRPGKKITEISAAGTGLGSFASGLASTLGSSGGAAAGVAGAIGAAAQPTPGASSADSADIAAAKMGQQMATSLGPQLLKAWNTEVQKWMQTYQVPSVASANTTDQAALKGALKALVDKTLRIDDYTQFPGKVADDADSQAAAKAIVNSITNSIDLIFDITSGVIKGDVKNQFISLVKQGIGPAMGMQQFNAKASTGSLGRSPVSSAMSPSVQDMARETGLDQNNIDQMREFARNNPQQALDAFRELAGIPATVK